MQWYGIVCLFASWPYALDIKHRVFAGGSCLYHLLQFFKVVDGLVIDFLYDETSRDTCVFQYAIVYLNDFNTVVDAKLSLLSLCDFTEIAS